MYASLAAVASMVQKILNPPLVSNKFLKLVADGSSSLALEHSSTRKTVSWERTCSKTGRWVEAGVHKAVKPDGVEEHAVVILGLQGHILETLLCACSNAKYVSPYSNLFCFEAQWTEL